MRFRHLLIALSLAAIAVISFTGCGQKGPLVPPKTLTTLATAASLDVSVHANGMAAGV